MAFIPPMQPINRNQRWFTRSGRLTETGYRFLHDIWRTSTEVSHRNIIGHGKMVNRQQDGITTDAHGVLFFDYPTFVGLQEYDMFFSITDVVYETFTIFGVEILDSIEVIAIDAEKEKVLDDFSSQSEYDDYLADFYTDVEAYPQFVWRSGAINLKHGSYLDQTEDLIGKQNLVRLMYIKNSWQGFTV